MNRDNPTRRDVLKNAVLSVGLLTGLPSPCHRNCFAQFGQMQGSPLPIYDDNPSIRHIQANCVECGRCRTFCHDVTTVYGHSFALEEDDEDSCIYCGQCTLYCQAEAIAEQYHYPFVSQALKNPEKIVVVSTSPAVRVSLGEEFGMAPGTNVEGKIVSGLKKLGADYVLDTTFAADLTVMEEASELVKRLTDGEKNRPQPMFTSCCPAWVRFAKLFYPKLLPGISRCKSPVMMQGALVKTYFAENYGAQKHGIDPKKIFHVALTPCTAKKAEILLPEINASSKIHGVRHMRDVDVSLTCRELALLLKDAKIDFRNLPDADYDPLMGAGSGAGVIFGNTGGVTEAVLRTAYHLLNGKNPPEHFIRHVETSPVRGLRYGREATVDLGVRKLKIAMIHGIGFARPFLEALQRGETDHEFVEIMACPGGCIGGGGQPNNRDLDGNQVRRQRITALYKHDTEQKVRLSYENPDIKTIYADFLGKPLGEKSEQLLHVAGR